MTDMDGSQNLQGNEGEGNTHSAGSADAGLQETLEAISARLSNLEGQQRALQSDKDRGIVGLQQEVHQMQSNFAEILEYGKRYADPAEAERNYKIDQFLQTANAEGNQSQGEQQVDGQPNPTQANANVTPEILQQYGIDPQSPEYLAQIKAGKSSFEASLAVLAGQSAIGEQGEDFASGASGGASNTAPASGQERNQQLLKQQYDAEVEKVAGENGGYLSPRQLYFIQEKYINQHGLNPQTLGW